MLVEELFESVIGILEGELLAKEIVVVVPAVPVGEVFIGFGDVMKLIFSLPAIVPMAVWVPLAGQSLVGLLDLEGAGRGGNL